MDCHDLQRGADRKSEIDEEGVLHIQDNVRLDQCLKPSFANLKPVGTWAKVPQNVDTLWVSLARRCHAREIVDCQNVGSRNGSTRRVQENATDRAIGGLPCKGKHYGNNNEKDNNDPGEAHVNSPVIDRLQ